MFEKKDINNEKYDEKIDELFRRVVFLEERFADLNNLAYWLKRQIINEDEVYTVTSTDTFGVTSSSESVKETTVLGRIKKLENNKK